MKINTKLLRKAMDVRWSDYVTNEEVSWNMILWPTAGSVAHSDLRTRNRSPCLSVNDDEDEYDLDNIYPHHRYAKDA